MNGTEQWTHQYKLVVFSHTAETIGSTITAQVIERDGRHKGGMALTTGNDTLFPWRKQSQKIVLPTSLRRGSLRMESREEEWNMQV
jgi:hypothetical protein